MQYLCICQQPENFEFLKGHWPAYLGSKGAGIMNWVTVEGYLSRG